MDALALRADEGRDKLRKASGRSKYPLIQISEWGNPLEQTSSIHTPIHNVWKGTGGTETSKYPEEKKETSISKVAASEMERAQTGVRALRGSDCIYDF